MDYLNDKFYYFYGSGVSANTHDIGRWAYQSSKNDTIHEKWNNGTLTAKGMRNYSYYFIGAYEGSITTDLDALKNNIKGFDRINENGIIEEKSPEGSEYIEGWENIVDECYNSNKDLALRNENDMLDVTKAKQVTIDACPTYAEEKTITYWIYDNDIYKNSVMPYREKPELISDFDNLLKGNYNDDQKELIRNAKSYVNSLNDKDYLCRFNNGNISLSYNAPQASGKTDYRYNTYKVSSFNYHLQNKDGSVTVDYTI